MNAKSGAATHVKSRLPARPAEQRAGGPDGNIRCKFCDHGLLPGEVFTNPRQCCKEGFLADAASIAKEKWP